MPSYTVQTLVDRAAKVADMEDGTFVEPQDWLDWYNEQSRALQLFLLRNNYVDWPGNLTSVSYDSATGTIEPSVGTMAVISVFEIRDNRYRRLRPRPWQDLNLDLTALANRITGDAWYYSVVTSTDDVQVVLEPRPVSGTYKAIFVKDLGTADSLTDSYNWPFGFERRIVLGMAKQALIKENSDTSQVDEQIQEMERQIEEHCSTLAARDGMRVRNIDREDRGWSRWYDELPYGPWESWYWL